MSSLKSHFNRISVLIGTLLLIALLYQPVFGHLGTFPIRMWDESRLAVNAYEMYRDGDIIVTRFGESPDRWNTKPPLLIWCQALCMKIFGPGEFALRLPSAMATFLTCCFLLFFCSKYLKKYWLGFIAVLFLITATGYVREHGTRTGDYEAMLALFTTLSYLFFFIFLETNKKKYLYYFFIGLALGVLTKSVSCLIFLPGLAVYILCQKKLLYLLKNRDFYIGLGIFLILVFGYYITRELVGPGYLKTVYGNELGGRFLHVQDEHNHNGWYYITNFIKQNRFAFSWTIPTGLLIGLLSKDQKVKRLTLYSFIMIIGYTLFISISKTKLNWYDHPLYPFLAILAGLFCYTIFDLINKIPASKHQLIFNILPFVFLFVVFKQPYQKIFNMTNSPVESKWGADFYRVSYFLRDGLRGKKDLNGYTIIVEAYEPQIFFYTNILCDRGVKLKKTFVSGLTTANNVIASKPQHHEYIKENFEYEITYHDKNLIVYNLTAKQKIELSQ
ncbi:MAG: glycosyltransferase family 39 protein [Bacteroidales bacterium]|jgi:4-amino-4-deoxy-L-arabinose transferase-like glycosyltransferase|nr:glycosyltransferase family 39 protein [Bacteroidales bacterium]